MKKKILCLLLTLFISSRTSLVFADTSASDSSSSTVTVTQEATDTETVTESTSSSSSPESTESEECQAEYKIEPIFSSATSPAIIAESAIVMDLDTGTILYEKDPYKKEYPASITKIMTSLLAIENNSLNDIVTISDNAYNNTPRDSSQIGLIVGEQLTVEQCVYAIMLESANEAAYAIAEHTAGNLQSFVDMMNAKAQEIGCVNTHFANANGLHDDNHYVCAYDMALISQEALKNNIFSKISSTTSYTIPATNLISEERTLWNHHKMLFPTSEYYYQYCYGGKTGRTDEAGRTLVTFAKNGDLNLVCVVMKTAEDAYYSDTKSLLDYCFSNYNYVTPLTEFNFNLNNDSSANFIKENYYRKIDHNIVSISYDPNFKLLVPTSVDSKLITQKIILSNKDDTGTIYFYYDGKAIGKTSITYEKFIASAPSSFFEKGQQVIRKYPIIVVCLVIIIVVVILLIVVLLKYRKSRNFQFVKKKRGRWGKYSRLGEVKRKQRSMKKHSRRHHHNSKSKLHF